MVLSSVVVLWLALDAHTHTHVHATFPQQTTSPEPRLRRLTIRWLQGVRVQPAGILCSHCLTGGNRRSTSPYFVCGLPFGPWCTQQFVRFPSYLSHMLIYASCVGIPRCPPRHVSLAKAGVSKVHRKSRTMDEVQRSRTAEQRSRQKLGCARTLCVFHGVESPAADHGHFLGSVWLALRLRGVPSVHFHVLSIYRQGLVAFSLWFLCNHEHASRHHRPKYFCATLGPPWRS